MAEAGDPSYAGFRISEMWAVTAVDPADDQEGICGIPDGHGSTMPLVGSDRSRVQSHLEPMARMFRDGGVPAEVKHFRLVPPEDGLAQFERFVRRNQAEVQLGERQRVILEAARLVKAETDIEDDRGNLDESYRDHVLVLCDLVLEVLDGAVDPSGGDPGA